MRLLTLSALLLLQGISMATAQIQSESPSPTPNAVASTGTDVNGSLTPYGDPVQNYTLAWSDEFNGNTLDLNKWEYRTDSKMWSTQTPGNISVSNGCMNIALKREQAGGKSYTGGGIISRQMFEYGYYEARFKVPPGSGWHTSFWVSRTNDKGGIKPSGIDEIDFCEQDSVKLINYSAGEIAWDQHGRGYGRKYVHTPNLHDDFHVWGCEFTPTVVKFFFDGKLTHQTDATKFKHGPANIWLTCISSPLGGTKRVDQTLLPAAAQFDYVRYFTKAAQ